MDDYLAIAEMLGSGKEKIKAGFVTKPAGVSSGVHKTGKRANSLPIFINEIHLKTEGGNLKLGFGYRADETSNPAPIPQIVMDSETARLLLLTLAELFHCEVKSLD